MVCWRDFCGAMAVLAFVCAQPVTAASSTESKSGYALNNDICGSGALAFRYARASSPAGTTGNSAKESPRAQRVPCFCVGSL